ncbi:hypothetical protein [Synechocystis salina]|uniref:Uncharacterized protein n=1 Tax=Synechocystis salina LEGE 00031 TaxID=1828736 RepID=A0ABR9VVL3_9SYNC|nr:hypothetical protein [Synechocystis salina]MBE9241947.1 hypothetical protein [Synechocystis salina LEGE 00041]MBE9255392.1 hypothetical protein [Synechocystis salina LEGE 00031]
MLKILQKLLIGALTFFPTIALAGVPNGTWLSQPQIRFYANRNALDQVMRDIQSQGYRLVFLDFRGVADDVQEQVSQQARNHNLIPIAWIQSPQLRSLTIGQIIEEARHTDGLQVDDHFFANYSARDFEYLANQYKKFIFCSIQPFQKNLVPRYGCNQIDVQCYTSPTFKQCLNLANQLNAVVSLYEKDTFKYRTQIGGKNFNVFLWPYINQRISDTSNFR